MRLDGRLRSIVAKLLFVLESDHFIIRYGLRNLTHGKGLGVGGVRDRTLVSCYLDALERLYSTMINQPLVRRPPPIGSEGKTAAYVFDLSEIFFSDGSPFTAADLDGIPYIGLPCRSNEPTTYAELQRAAADAVHEATHIFNCRERPFRDLNSELWQWFDEATAVFMEALVLSGNPDNLRFAMDWSDRPEVPIDDWSVCYETYLFVRYLAKRMGLGFISKVWMEAEERETPLEALARLLRQEGQAFSSADPGIRDIFASGYCLDSYFLFDHNSPGFAPDVYARYGKRAITESFILRANSKVECEGSLDHLACRYYRLYLKDGVTKLQVQVRGSFRTLKADLAVVTAEMQRGIVEPFRPTSSPGAGDSVRLSVEVTQLDPERIDHLVLVVSNCGLRAAQVNPDIEHDDGQEYTIEASAF